MKQLGKTFQAGMCMIVEKNADHLECWLLQTLKQKPYKNSHRTNPVGESTQYCDEVRVVFDISSWTHNRLSTFFTS